MIDIIFNAITLLLVGLLHWKLRHYIIRSENKFDALMKRNKRYFDHLLSELDVPTPQWETRITKDHSRKPQVVKRTENDEYEKELPPQSGERSI